MSCCCCWLDHTEGSGPASGEVSECTEEEAVGRFAEFPVGVGIMGVSSPTKLLVREILGSGGSEIHPVVE